MATKKTSSSKKSSKTAKTPKTTPKTDTRPKTAPGGDVMETGADAPHPLQTLRQEIDQVFDNMFANFPARTFARPHFDMPGFDLASWREPFRDPFKRFEDTFGALNRMSPRADLKETETGFEITAEMPGVAESDIDISVTDRRITVKAEKKQEEEKDDDNMHLTERHYGSIQRTFSLPDTADVDKANATFTDGVLKVDVPKIPSAKGKPKKIPLGK